MDDAFRREYRLAKTGLLWGLCAPAVVPGVALVVDLALDDEVPAAVAIAVGAVFAALLLWVVLSVTGAATIVDATQVTIRGAFGSHATAWPDVQGIEIELNPAAVRRGLPERIVVLYDSSGRRLVLPHLNDRAVADLEGEVEDLRAAWMLRRGEDWAPVGKAADKIARARAYPRPLAHIAVGAMLCAMMAGTVLFCVILVTGLYDVISENPVTETLFHPAAVIGVMPLLVYIGTLVIGGIRRRR